MIFISVQSKHYSSDKTFVFSSFHVCAEVVTGGKFNDMRNEWANRERGDLHER